MRATIEFVKFPSWDPSTWAAFINKSFVIPKGCCAFELGLMAAGRLGYPQKN